MYALILAASLMGGGPALDPMNASDSIKVRQIAEEMMKLRFRSAVGQLEQQHCIKGLKRDLARVLTVSRGK